MSDYENDYDEDMLKSQNKGAHVYDVHGMYVERLQMALDDMDAYGTVLGEYVGEIFKLAKNQAQVSEHTEKMLADLQPHYADNAVLEARVHYMLGTACLHHWYTSHALSLLEKARSLDPDNKSIIECSFLAYQSALEASKDSLQRTLAEKENAFKRWRQESIREKLYATKQLMSDLCLPFNQMDMALSMMKQPGASLANCVLGLEFVQKELEKTLQKNKIEVINPQIGDKFDASYQEAVEKVQHDQMEPGYIAKVLGKGYIMASMLIQPAKVIVVAEVE